MNINRGIRGSKNIRTGSCVISIWRAKTPYGNEQKVNNPPSAPLATAKYRKKRNLRGVTQLMKMRRQVLLPLDVNIQFK